MSAHAVHETGHFHEQGPPRKAPPKALTNITPSGVAVNGSVKQSLGHKSTCSRRIAVWALLGAPKSLKVSVLHHRNLVAWYCDSVATRMHSDRAIRRCVVRPRSWKCLNEVNFTLRLLLRNRQRRAMEKPATKIWNLASQRNWQSLCETFSLYLFTGLWRRRVHRNRPVCKGENVLPG